MAFIGYNVRCATILPLAFPDNTPHWKWVVPALLLPGIFLSSIPLSKLFHILSIGGAAQIC